MLMAVLFTNASLYVLIPLGIVVLIALALGVAVEVGYRRRIKHYDAVFSKHRDEYFYKHFNTWLDAYNSWNAARIALCWAMDLSEALWHQSDLEAYQKALEVWETMRPEEDLYDA